MNCKRSIYGRITVLLASAMHFVDNGDQMWSEMPNRGVQLGRPPKTSWCIYHNI